MPCAVELIKLIRKLHGDYFCIGVTGHPDAHTSKCETDTTGVDCVVNKVVAGGDFVVPEFVFEVDSFVSWRQSLELAGVSCPILATIMPIQVRRWLAGNAFRVASRVPRAHLAVCSRTPRSPDLHGRARSAFHHPCPHPSRLSWTTRFECATTACRWQSPWSSRSPSSSCTWG